MAGGFLDNLVTSLGGSKDGPDPNRLEGLLECARSGMAPDELRAAAAALLALDPDARTRLDALAADLTERPGAQRARAAMLDGAGS